MALEGGTGMLAARYAISGQLEIQLNPGQLMTN